MKQFINHSLASQFKKSIPEIKKQIGQKPLHSDDATFGVAGNTFRAYRGWIKPGVTYKSWAKHITVSLKRQASLEGISTPEGFPKWHKRLYTSLQRYWEKHQGKQLQLSHCYKLIDLYIKWLSGHQLQDNKTLEGIVRHANCALDSQILGHLNKCYSMAFPIFKPSMGHIHNENTYIFCQALITAFSEPCGGSRLLFDNWAWEKGNG